MFNFKDEYSRNLNGINKKASEISLEAMTLPFLHTAILHTNYNGEQEYPGEPVLEEWKGAT